MNGHGLQYLPANLHPSRNSCTWSNGKGVPQKPMSLDREGYYGTRHRHFLEPSSAKSTTRAPSSLGLTGFGKQLPGKLFRIWLFDDALFDLGMNCESNLSPSWNVETQCSTGVILGDDMIHPGLDRFSASKCHTQYQKALTLHLKDWCWNPGNVERKHSACLWRHLRNKAWPDQLWHSRMTLLQCWWLSNRLPHSCRASHTLLLYAFVPVSRPASKMTAMKKRRSQRTAVMLSFFLFFLLLLFLLLKDLALPESARSSNPIQVCTVLRATIWILLLVQQHSDLKHRMPTILMSCDAKDVSRKILMKLYETTQMSSRRLVATTAVPQVERPVAQCAEVLLGQGHIWSAPAIKKKTSSNGTTEQKQLTCYSWHGKNKSDLLGLFILFTLIWSCCKDGWKTAPRIEHYMARNPL